MKNRFKFLTLFLLFLFLLLFSSILNAYQYTDLLNEDFTEGSMENWMVILGEWEVGDAEMCQLQCGT